MEKYTVAGLMAANRLQSQSPYNELLLARLPLANRENVTREQLLAKMSDSSSVHTSGLVNQLQSVAH
ncbi:MAG: hypothetical protein P8Q48_11080 [Paracoccaceae bacterium]|nr:hypothetical protein [Paracoccaceae bacterium]